MLTRKGLVSNSSSSSFVLSGSTSIKEVADMMLRIVEEDWIDWSDDSNNSRKEKAETKARFKEYRANLAKAPEDMAITLPSTNYETYICRLPSGNIYVETCNNHNWEPLLEDAEQILYDSDDTNEYTKIANTQWYYDVGTGNIHSKGILNGWNLNIACKSCKRMHACFDIYLNDECELICGSCGKPL